MTSNDDLTLVWKALADPTRRTLLDLLRERPRTTGELCAAFEVTRYAVMKHLTVLEEAELIAVRRQGRERWNYLNAVPLQRIYERWLRPYEAKWASALLQLKQHVETKGQSTTMAEKAVTTAAMNDIHIEQDITIQAPPEKVFEAITQDIACWWTLPFFHAGAATKRLVLEAHVGGRFYEDMGDNQGLLLASVTSIKQPQELRLTGSMGLIGPVYGVVYLQLEPKEAGTILKLSHRMVGEVNEEVRGGYSQGWQELLETRLRNYVEHGTRYDLGPESLPDSAE